MATEMVNQDGVVNGPIHDLEFDARVNQIIGADRTKLKTKWLSFTSLPPVIDSPN
jgi:hypothetical protein